MVRITEDGPFPLRTHEITNWFLAIAAAVFLGVSLPATTPLMPIDEIKPGMVGVGRTIFEGTDLQEFKAHILGVLRNIQGPRRDLILARLEGDRLAKTGVAAGMSGSPVYIDGRLIGAVSSSIGAFPTEAIAGITPIAEMKDATQMTRRAGRRRRASSCRSRVKGCRPRSSRRIGGSRRSPTAPPTCRYSGIAGRRRRTARRDAPADLDSSGDQRLRARIGRDPACRSVQCRRFHTGLRRRLGGQVADAAQEAPAGPLREGDAVGVSLVGGDLEMGATGTITHIDGDRIYAFGHPFFNLGPSQFPMTRAYVHTMLPSLMSSFKISSMGEVIGTMQQDRATAIAGTLGKGPTVIPMTVTLATRDDGSATKRSFTYQVANDQVFTPLLSYIALANTISAYERQFGSATFSVKSRARIQGHSDLTVEDVFTGDNATLGAATAVAGPINMLLANDREPVTVNGVDVSIEASEKPRSVTIERIWLDEVRPRAGRTVPLKVLTRSYRGEEKISTVPIEIPANVSGSLSILVTDGRQLNVMEQRDLRRSLQPASVAQMIRVLNDTRRNNRIYIRLLNGRPGAVVNGEALTALPPSILSVLESDSNGGSYTPIRSAAVGQWEVPMDSAVIGSRC